METTKVKLYGRNSTDGTLNTAMSIDLNHPLGRHNVKGSWNAQGYNYSCKKYSASSESIESRGRTATPTDINIQVGVRWDSDRVSLDGSLTDSHASDENNKSNFNNSRRESDHTIKKISPSHLSVIPRPRSKSHESLSPLPGSKSESHSLKEIEMNSSRNVMKLQPRSPTIGKPWSSKPNDNSFQEAKNTMSPSKRKALSPDIKTEKLPERFFPDSKHRKDIEVPLYRGNVISEIVENLYVGSIKAAYNEQLLCRLKVDCIVDLSDSLPDQVPNQMKSLCPCTCSLQIYHSRAKLRIGLENNSTDIKDYEDFMDEINRFIEAARLSSRAVLVHSYDGISRAPFIVVQYLMKCQGMNLNQGYELLKRRWTTININRQFINYLVKLDSELFPGQKISFAERLDPFVTTEVAVKLEDPDSTLGTLHRKGSVKAWI